MTTGTVTLHRVITAPSERVYRALLDPDAMAKFLPPHGFTGRVLEMDARVGGIYRMQFTNFSSGQTHAFGGKYLELVPFERIVNTDVFDDPQSAGADDHHDHAQGGVLRHRAHRRSAGHSRHDPHRGLLPGLATDAAVARPTGGSRDPGLTPRRGTKTLR